jgi:hypothetical protein
MRWLRRGALATLIFAACWIGAIWYWRATNRMPATGDVALYFVALPLALVFVVWLARRLPALLTSAAAATPAVAASGDPAPPAPEAPPALAIMDAAVRLPHAQTCDELATALADGSARPALDATLVDDDGYPVMTVRADVQPDPAFETDTLNWFGQQGMHDIAPTAAQWRALGMASAVVADVAGPAAAGYDEGAAPMLRLVALLPPAWPRPLQAAAAQWLGHVAAQAGWPAKQMHVEIAPPAPVPALLQRLAEGGAPYLALVVACDSHLAQADIDDWSNAGTLFTARHPQGLIPGEGAAALLLADPASAGRAMHTVLHAPAGARLDQSADIARRVDSVPLSTLIDQAVARAGTTAGTIALVIADSSQRVNRVLEVAGALGAALPHLDAGDDVLTVGAASGACGAVPLLAALALAHQQAHERGAPVLCLGNEDPFDRCAAVVGPVAFVPLSISSESAR